MPSATRQFRVSAADAGTRLDKFVAAQLPELSRNRLQALIQQGHVLVDGGLQKPSYPLDAGELIIVGLPEARREGVLPEKIPLEVLYEDSDIAVINKPAGMIVHPGAQSEKATLVAALLDRYQGAEGLSSVGGPLRPGIVHRLDKDTSGAIVVARTDRAHASLVLAFSLRHVEKTYLALLHGAPHGATAKGSGRIELPIARDLRRRSRMTTRRERGRQARTDWRVLGRLGPLALVEADIHTGRTHQIRVHFSALGTPVVGDTVYGAPRLERVGRILLPELGRNFLHAARLAFAHPRTGEPLEVRAPLSSELRAYLGRVAEASETPQAVIDAALRPYL